MIVVETSPQETHHEDHPCVACLIRMQRLYVFFVIQFFLPPGLVGMLAMMSFWIDKEAVAARVTLCKQCNCSLISNLQTY